MTTKSTAKTPGYNTRLQIFFSRDRNSRKIAFRWSAMQMRAFRMKVADAEAFIAQEQADELPGHPLKDPATFPDTVSRADEQDRINKLDRSQPIALRAEIVRAVEAREPFDVDGMTLGLMLKDFNPYPMTEWGAEYEMLTGDVVLMKVDDGNPPDTLTLYSVRSGVLMSVATDRVEALA